MKKHKKLNLGCGREIVNRFPSPWLNVDVAGDCAEYYCDIRKLPEYWFERFLEVRVSHVLEHFYLEEFNQILDEWFRVLQPGGMLRIIVPDFEVVLAGLVFGQDAKGRTAFSIEKTTPILSQIYGQGYESRVTPDEWRHHFIFTKETLTSLLQRQKSVQKVFFYDKIKDPAAHYGIKDDSQNLFSLCVCAIKKK